MSVNNERRSRRICSKKICNAADSSVFVFPPEVLQKMGINLDAFLNSKNDGDTSNLEPSIHINKGQNIKKQKKNYSSTDNRNDHKANDNSFLETAKLMKDSLFLSPTFNNGITNTVDFNKNSHKQDSEKDYHTNYTTARVNSENTALGSHDTQQNVNILSNIGIVVAEKDPGFIPTEPKDLLEPIKLLKPPNNVLHCNDMDLEGLIEPIKSLKSPNSVVHCNDMDLENNSALCVPVDAQAVLGILKTNDITESNTVSDKAHATDRVENHFSDDSSSLDCRDMDICKDDHLDEAYLSDYSNSNYGGYVTPVPSQNLAEVQGLKQRNIEIQIISEDSVLLPYLKNSQILEKSLIPVSLNTIIQVKPKHTNVDQVKTFDDINIVSENTNSEIPFALHDTLDIENDITISNDIKNLEENIQNIQGSKIDKAVEIISGFDKIITDNSDILIEFIDEANLSLLSNASCDDVCLVENLNDSIDINKNSLTNETSLQNSKNIDKTGVIEIFFENDLKNSSLNVETNPNNSDNKIHQINKNSSIMTEISNEDIDNIILNELKTMPLYLSSSEEINNDIFIASSNNVTSFHYNSETIASNELNAGNTQLNNNILCVTANEMMNTSIENIIEDKNSISIDKNIIQESVEQKHVPIKIALSQADSQIIPYDIKCSDENTDMPNVMAVIDSVETLELKSTNTNAIDYCECISSIKNKTEECNQETGSTEDFFSLSPIINNNVKTINNSKSEESNESTTTSSQVVNSPPVEVMPIEKDNNYLETDENKKKLSNGKQNYNSEVEEIASHLKKVSHIFLKHRKLMINEEGIEKPGGKINKIKLKKHGTKKMYSKCYVNKCPKKMHNDSILSLNKIISEGSNKKISLANVRKNESLDQQFCSCSDYGHLSFKADDDIPYQHIHFGHNGDTSYVLDFEEFDYVKYIEDRLDNSDEVITENTNETYYSLCWKALSDPCSRQYLENFSLKMIQQLEKKKLSNPSKHDELVAVASTVESVTQTVDSADLHSSNTEEKIKRVEPQVSQTNESVEVDLIQPDNKSDDLPLSRNILSQESNDKEQVKNEPEPVSTPTCKFYEISTRDQSKSDLFQNNANSEMLEQNTVTPSDVTMMADDSNTTTQLESSTEDYKCDMSNSDELVEVMSIIVEPIQENKDSESDKKQRKRSRCQSPNNSVGDLKSPPNKKHIKCGVCKDLLEVNQWDNHVRTKHCYVAWRNGEEFDFADANFLLNIKREVKVKSKLKCTFCGQETSSTEKFIMHVENCFKIINDIVVNDTDSAKKLDLDIADTDNITEAKCGKCHQTINIDAWYDHIKTEHKYLAWKDFEAPLDLSDRKGVYDHLREIMANLDMAILECHTCKLTFKTVRKFVIHIEKKCTEPVTIGVPDLNTESFTNDVTQDLKVDNESFNNTLNGLNDTEIMAENQVTCGVCNMNLASEDWISHIQSNHGYLAWKSGMKKFDTNNKNAVLEHLNKIKNDLKMFKCNKCGTKRKDPFKFLKHFNSCKLDNYSICGVCNEQIPEDIWTDHVMDEHYNIAWRVGENPIDPGNEDIILKMLSMYKKHKKEMICTLCSQRKYSINKFYDHIKSCGKKEEHKSDRDMDTPVNLRTHRRSSTRRKESNDLNESAASIGSPVSIIKKEQHNASDRNADEEIDKTSRESDTSNADYVVIEVPALEDSSPLLNIQVKIEQQNVSEQNTDQDLDSSIGDSTSRKSVLSSSATNESLVATTPQTGSPLAKKRGRQKRLKVSVQNEDKDIDTPVKKRMSRKRRHSSNNTKEIQPQESSSIDNDINTSVENEESAVVTCGVCNKEVPEDRWMDHAMDEHYNIAWRVGDEPIDLRNLNEVRKALYGYKKVYPRMSCKLCSVSRSSCDGFFAHIAVCGKSEEEIEKAKVVCPICNEKVLEVYRPQHMLSHSQAAISGIVDKSAESASKTIEQNTNAPVVIDDLTTEAKDIFGDFKPDAIVTCGVCAVQIPNKFWVNHIKTEHKYAAWKVGTPEFDINDPDSELQYLEKVAEILKTFVCSKCGLKRKCPQKYLKHYTSCTKDIEETKEQNRIDFSHHDKVSCGVCKREIPNDMWSSHAIKEHYNITWRVGEEPINLKNAKEVEKALRVYKKVKPIMSCRVCGLSRASLMGFFAHIAVCGKTDEEIEELKEECPTCGQKFLGVYRQQHMQVHIMQQFTAENKKAKQVEEETEETDIIEANGTTRRAAMKAKRTIKKYNSDNDTVLYCEFCDYSTDIVERMDKHKIKCTKPVLDETNLNNLESEEETEDEGSVGCVVSDQEEVGSVDMMKTDVKEKVRDIAPRSVFGDAVPKEYMKKCYQEFVEQHCTSNDLFPEFRNMVIETVSNKEINSYLPPIEESCNIKGEEDWFTVKRFECVKERRASVLFTGGSIQCCDWASPTYSEVDNDYNYLAVACHIGNDSPWLPAGQIFRHKCVIQLWNFHNFVGPPSICACICLDSGTVWDMQWCPSGARDSSDSNDPRLGLLAIACSDGNAYILSVPIPPCVTGSPPFIKIKPTVKLRLKPSYTAQATTLYWSKQKGHKIICVGYCDGTVAQFDLFSNSPLNTHEEDGVTVLYPYHDHRYHISPISGVSMHPTLDDDIDTGMLTTSSGNGSRSICRPTLPVGAVHSHSSVRSNLAVPHWPSTIIFENTSYMLELDWSGGNRRFGLSVSGAACGVCGAAALAGGPAVRLLDTHPVYRERCRGNFMLLEMEPLSGKRNEKNTKLKMVVEPFSYEEAVAKYGIAYDFNLKRRDLSQNKPDSHPDRFPLAEVKSLKYCPTQRHHNQLAIATHSGVIILTKT